MIDVDAVKAVEVCLMAVLVPPASSVRHSTAGDERRWVAVFGGEQAVVVVTEGIALNHRNEEDKNQNGSFLQVSFVDSKSQ